ncbi:BspA family leucine-rich repeat surface protein [Muricauda sp. TY007]|uniref:BspA family leucine-rich repeat surface protein n=1 Tax=Allomuricauda sp. TY007 TaxID=2683200 RepID=UPI0013C18490|nr:BspA family leucine-rich repeat surface protein [Muricauda sp. TY007]NDV14814.1 BspA family leucine-rich repeat surface protein [Muricauda sp. TY007]
MKSTLNKFGTTVIALVMLWSCEKDDGPKSFANQPPVIYDQSFHVPEAITGGQTVAEVKAYDSNMGTKLTYNIAADDSDMFEISPKTGFLSIKAGKELDLEAPQFHKITVEVSDGVRQDTGQITICDCVPVFAQKAYEFEVSEDISTEELIHTFEVEDADTDIADLVFNIPTNDNGLFAISEAGELSLAAGQQLDYETSKEHHITVSVEDDNATVEVAVKIIVINDGDTLAEDPKSFVTTWKTETDGEEITFEIINNYYTYNYTIDWGDGTVEGLTEDDGHPSHIYASAGTYTVAIHGEFPTVLFNDPQYSSKLLSLEQWGSIKWEYLSYTFGNCENMVYNATDVPDLSKVTSTSGMFYEATSFNGDLSDWDVSHVTTMIGMFAGATSFNGDLSGWDVSHVTGMGSMFRDATSFNGDVSDWDVNNVTTMENMFKGATSFNQDLGGWDIGSVTTMIGMLDNSGMSKANLGSTFIGWNNYLEQNGGPEGITLGLDNLAICLGSEGYSAFQNLYDNHSWDYIGQYAFEECN